MPIQTHNNPIPLPFSYFLPSQFNGISSNISKPSLRVNLCGHNYVNMRDLGNIESLVRDSGSRIYTQPRDSQSLWRGDSTSTPGVDWQLPSQEEEEEEPMFHPVEVLPVKWRTRKRVQMECQVTNGTRACLWPLISGLRLAHRVSPPHLALSVGIINWILWSSSVALKGETKWD